MHVAHVFFQTILKSRVDSVNFYNEGSELETMCPPMICLRIQPRRGVPNLTEEVFELKVVGAEDVSFRIMTGMIAHHDSIDSSCNSIRCYLRPHFCICSFIKSLCMVQCYHDANIIVNTQNHATTNSN